LALLFAYYICRSFKGSQFFRYMLMLPSFISPVVLVMIFTYVVEYAIPAIFSVRSLFDGPPIQQLFVVILYNTLVGFGSGVLMYSNAMARIPVSLTEYGKLEGISPIREFFTVVLPCIYPTLETFLIIGVSQIFIDQANLIHSSAAQRIFPFKPSAIGCIRRSWTAERQCPRIRIFPQQAWCCRQLPSPWS
jgi:ABC-type sugar transport system permease subunit